MEHPQYRKDQEFNPLQEGDAGNLEEKARNPNFNMRAGHISLGEQSQTGEINLHGKPHEARPLHLPKMPEVEAPASIFSPSEGPAFRPVQFNAPPKPALEATPLAPQAPVETPTPARVERSAWHDIALDNMGQVVETQHGDAFRQETQPEQMMAGAAAALPVADDQTAQPQPEPARRNSVFDPLPQQQSVQTVPQHDASGAPQQIQPQQPAPLQYAQQPYQDPNQTMPQPQPQVMPQYQQPIQPQSQQYYQEQPVPQQQYVQPQQPQPGYGQQPQAPLSPLAGAVNPSFPSIPHPGQPALPTGPATHVDPQHLLGKPSPIKALLKSPWIWLALGVGMIVYFGSKLFG